VSDHRNAKRNKQLPFSFQPFQSLQFMLNA
jgi:hypothetical protein